MGSLRQVAVFLSLAVFVAAFALAISGLTTDYWVDTEHVTRNSGVSALSFVHSGLFYGERQLDYGQEIKLEPFSVYDEIHKETSFMNRTLWILCIFFIALGILWVFVGLLISLMNSVKMNDETIIGPSGIYVWSILALLSFLAAIGIFVVQYFTSIMSNVLLPIHLNAGFSSSDQARLGYSFWLLTTAVGILIIPCALIRCTSPHRNHHTSSNDPIIDTTSFLY